MTSDNWAYSNAFLGVPIRLGSSASVTDFWGNVKSRDSQNDGWARSGAKKAVELALSGIMLWLVSGLVFYYTF